MTKMRATWWGSPAKCRSESGPLREEIDNNATPRERARQNMILYPARRYVCFSFSFRIFFSQDITLNSYSWSVLLFGSLNSTAKIAREAYIAAFHSGSRLKPLLPWLRRNALVTASGDQDLHFCVLAPYLLSVYWTRYRPLSMSDTPRIRGCSTTVDIY